MAAKAIVHSKHACEAVRTYANLREVVELPHPMFPPEKPAVGVYEGVAVRVLGQYKADRDVRAMEQLAAEGRPEWRYEAIGRGWPPICGWKVTDRFVGESEFDTLLRSSSVILIPYTRFFQSGVAIRCLEVGTPIVGPRMSSLADLLGSESGWLVDDGPWNLAVEAAIKADARATYKVAWDVYRKTFEKWRTWLAADVDDRDDASFSAMSSCVQKPVSN